MNDYTRQGWVRFYRKSIDSSVWKNPNVWFVWSWCLLKASHELQRFPFNGQDMEVKPGQFITGINKAISELNGLTAQNYRSVIKYLKSTGRITVNSNNKFSIITIVKWSEYQNKNPKITNKLTNEQQTTNKPLTTYKNDKNDKKNTGKKGFLQGNEINEIIELFKDVNPLYKEFYKNRSERSAIDILAKTIGTDKLKNTVIHLKDIINQPYAPKVTSPTQLKRDLGKLVTFFKQEKLKVNKNAPNYVL